MGAVHDAKLEAFSLAYARLIAEGVKRSDAAFRAAVEAKYPNPQSRSFAANARKRARRPDVKARVAALMARGIEEAEDTVTATIEWATRKLTTIVNYDLGSKAVKIPDQLKALELLARMKGWMAPDKHDLLVRRAEEMTDDELLRIAANGRPGITSAPLSS